METNPTATKAPPIERIVRPFQRFQRVEASGGIVLLACALIAVIWANSPWGETYEHLLHTEISFGIAGQELSQTLHHWINDWLMAIFFFVVGLEIKRELLVGELASLRLAAVPILAAVGGMVGPALLFVAINSGGDGMRGWGIPMATDIAFALGIMSLLGKRVPIGLKVFLTAVAIVDDIGAVLVIAVFYTEEIRWSALGFASVFFVLMMVANQLGVRRPLVYLILGAGLWLGFLGSGVHATIAGIIGAVTIPASMRINEREFAGIARAKLEQFETAARKPASILTNESEQAAVHGLEKACEKVQPPLLRIEHMLVPWIAFFIMPVFALANAGVHLDQSLIDALKHPIAIGVGLGLVLGKQIGVFGATWLAVKLKIGSLPAGSNWRHIYGAACLAGIGFTMSLFIANLAYDEVEQLNVAKVGILMGSLVASIVGLVVLWFAAPVKKTTLEPNDAIPK